MPYYHIIQSMESLFVIHNCIILITYLIFVFVEYWEYVPDSIQSNEDIHVEFN